MAVWRLQLLYQICLFHLGLLLTYAHYFSLLLSLWGEREGEALLCRLDVTISDMQSSHFCDFHISKEVRTRSVISEGPRYKISADLILMHLVPSLQ